MKEHRSVGWLFLFSTLCSVSLVAQDVPLSIIASGERVEVSWSPGITNSDRTISYPDFALEYTVDLRNWNGIPGRMHGLADRFVLSLSQSFDKQTGPVFYRLRISPAVEQGPMVAEGGAEVFGYNARFSTELDRLMLLPLEDFATNGTSVGYLPRLTWDPTSAQYWHFFSSTNMYYAVYGGSFDGTNIAYNFRLDPQELSLFETNGFVVSERLGSVTFGDAYYRIFNADLPVFITADSILHSWHRSYQSILEELEMLRASFLLERVVSNMSRVLPGIAQVYGTGALSNSILDADYYLTVARGLWATQFVPSALGNPVIDLQVQGTLEDVRALALKNVEIFGSNRWVDFSQFKVRGHYDSTEHMRRYFRTMMWCGRTDLRFATYAPNFEDDVRQLGTAVVLHQLLKLSGAFYDWQALEEITRIFVGTTDSMTFAQLGDVLAAAGIESLADVPDRESLVNLQTRLLTGELGRQNVHSDYFYSPLGPEQVRLPRSFTVCGQKFTFDSWAMSQVVFDRILWEPNDGITIIDGKVIRRKPSCLDVAYSVFGNDAVVPEIVERIQDQNGVPFRDGRPYHHNLLAVRKTFDALQPGAWHENIYTAWLAAIRALSEPTTGPQFPEAMRTRAWAMKSLNTQLASWTQLRHDTVLYAKQSYTEPLLCSYPAGFVEPLPRFWQKMKDLADLSYETLSNLVGQGSVDVAIPYPGGSYSMSFDLAQIKARQLGFLNFFSQQMLTLKGISEKELGQQPLSDAETNFLKDVVERDIDYLGVRRWNGWYPQLNYTNAVGQIVGSPQASQAPGCDIWDALATDVHTDLPDAVVADPGAIIHEGVGNVHMMLIAVDNGPDRMVYAGPVLSHYEFERPMNARLSDEEWKGEIRAGSKPPSPKWTESYLVPGAIVIPPRY
jgi:hypothetical protein